MLSFGSQGLKEPSSSPSLTKARRIRRRRWVLVMSMAVAVVVSKSHDACAFVAPTLHESHALHQRQWGARNYDGSSVATATAGIRRRSPAVAFATAASLAFESSMYDEQRPRRRRTGQSSSDGMHVVAEAVSTAASSKSTRVSWKESWGVETYQPELFRPNTRQTSRTDHSSVYHFPQTIDSITSAAARAIDTVLTVSCLTKGARSRRRGRAQPQLPAHVINSGGRIGIELDFGGGHDAPLHSGGSSGSSSSILKGRHDEAATVRYASLVLAAKLSQSSVSMDTASTKTDVAGANTKGVPSRHYRPVAVYFNTLQQALAASQQLLQLKRVERLRIMSRQSHQPPRDTTNATTAATVSSIATMYDSILIRCLCQGDSIPKEMLSKESVTPMLSPASKERRDGPAVDIQAGLVLIVQPTDYNDDYQPPGPVVTAVEALQRLAGQASIERLGMVVVSPRFGNHPRSASSLPLYSGSSTSTSSVSLRAVPVLDRWSRANGNDLLSTCSPQRKEPLPLPVPQLAIHDREQSSTYAGREPPRGPLPWIMRDFTPPVFTWVAHTLPMARQTSHSEPVMSSVNSEKASHLVMWQSILHQDASRPAWHLFAVSTQSTRLSSSTAKSLDSERTRIRDDKSSFCYIASTTGEAGRPTRDVVHQLFVDHEIYG